MDLKFEDGEGSPKKKKEIEEIIYNKKMKTFLIFLLLIIPQFLYVSSVPVRPDFPKPEGRPSSQIATYQLCFSNATAYESGCCYFSNNDNVCEIGNMQVVIGYMSYCPTYNTTHSWINTLVVFFDGDYSLNCVGWNTDPFQVQGRLFYTTASSYKQMDYRVQPISK